MTEDPDDPPADANGVLSSLPGTRPQRRSPKRAATKPARRATPAGTEAADPGNVAADPTELEPVPAEPQPTPAAGRDASAAKPRATRSKPATPKAEQPPTKSPAAAQGFEVDPLEGAVDPPTGVELLSSIAQGATELAELGVALTRRLARSLLDRLPRL